MRQLDANVILADWLFIPRRPPGQDLRAAVESIQWDYKPPPLRRIRSVTRGEDAVRRVRSIDLRAWIGERFAWVAGRCASMREDSTFIDAKRPSVGDEHAGIGHRTQSLGDDFKVMGNPERSVNDKLAIIGDQALSRGDDSLVIDDRTP